MKDKLNQFFEKNPDDYGDGMPVYTGEVQELSTKPVNMDDLLNKLNANKATELIKESFKPEKTVKTASEVRRKSRGLIDEDYLRHIIAEEVRSVFSEYLELYIDSIKNELSYLVAKKQIS